MCNGRRIFLIVRVLVVTLDFGWLQLGTATRRKSRILCQLPFFPELRVNSYKVNFFGTIFAIQLPLRESP